MIDTLRCSFLIFMGLFAIGVIVCIVLYFIRELGLDSRKEGEEFMGMKEAYRLILEEYQEEADKNNSEVRMSSKHFFRLEGLKTALDIIEHECPEVLEDEEE